jgi:predicted aminopeptidase
VAEIIADPASDPGFKAKLLQAQAIRDFASRELALPDNGSYRVYADLGRPYVVWNVFAAPEFSLKPEQWCVPVVGCVNYRGFFEEESAARLAGEMRQRGFDTQVVGIVAYSTLGYFDDPLLNTFLGDDETELARLVFHELAHQQVFAGGDSAFDESFATAVENEGVRRWLAQRANPELRRIFAARQARKAQLAELVAATRDRLAAVYATAPSTAEKRQGKAAAIAAMQRAYAELKASWGGRSGYDRWFGETPNNATIASFSLYTQLVPAFEALLAAEQRDLPRFYRRVKALAALGKAERLAALNGILAASRHGAVTEAGSGAPSTAE